MMRSHVFNRVSLLVQGVKEPSLKRQKGRVHFPAVRFLCGKGIDEEDSAISPLYLHVGPSGDCWTGGSIFAAKHLQPDYVKSVRLQPGMCAETLIQLLEENQNWSRRIYDEEKFPDELVDCLAKETKT